jgi:hypothetical protein
MHVKSCGFANIGRPSKQFVRLPVIEYFQSICFHSAFFNTSITRTRNCNCSLSVTPPAASNSVPENCFSFFKNTVSWASSMVRGASRVCKAIISPRWIWLIQPSVPKISTVKRVSIASDATSNFQPWCCFSFGNCSPSQYTPTTTPIVAATYTAKNTNFAISSGKISDALDSIVSVGFPIVLA